MNALMMDPERETSGTVGGEESLDTATAIFVWRSTIREKTPASSGLTTGSILSAFALAGSDLQQRHDLSAGLTKRPQRQVSEFQ